MLIKKELELESEPEPEKDSEPELESSEEDTSDESNLDEQVSSDDEREYILLRNQEPEFNVKEYTSKFPSSSELPKKKKRTFK